MGDFSGLRALLVTGKGGVGKTTVAAAIALSAARSGRRVLCAEISADERARSSLAEALGVHDLSEEPQQVAPNLQGVRLSPSAGHRRFLQHTLPLKMLADAAMRSTAVRRFLTAAPAFSEMGVLYRLLDLARQRRSDGTLEHRLLVVDMPATGHALALTQVPEVILKLLPGGPIGTAAREGLALLTDPTRCGALVVTLPETLPVTESLELARGLSRNRVPLAGMVLNRVPLDPFTLAERAALDLMLLGKGPMLGARALGVMDRAKEAAQRLLAGLDMPVTAVPEVAEKGKALTSSLAAAWTFSSAEEVVYG